MAKRYSPHTFSVQSPPTNDSILFLTSLNVIADIAYSKATVLGLIHYMSFKSEELFWKFEPPSEQ